MRRRPWRTFGVIGAALALTVAAAGCDPVENAPPGGGEIVQGTYRLGPFNLAAQGQPGDQSNTSQANIPRPAGAFGLKTMDFDIVDAAGTPVPHSAVHLHHVLLMNPGRQDLLCNRSERFAGAGSERTPMKLGDPYAYMVGANDRWNALWHIMNTGTTAREVYIQYKVGYQPGATAENTRGVTPFFLDITGCGNSEYDVPGNGGPGSVHTNARTWTMPWGGYHVSSGGHLHGGGIDISIRNDTTNITCTMTAHYEHSHPHDAPGSISTCPAHKRVEQGHSVTVTARYDNSEPHDSVMGIVLAYVWRGTQ